ncbi:EGF domain-containing protein [Salmonella sp. s54395]|uniref:EGF domain-containing protein n=1 Tax=Salmonella sp. s54395 TaxID=3159664 RepID=UPI003980B3B6
MNALCTDTDEGYTCSCVEGYEGDGYSCEALSGAAENVYRFVTIVTMVTVVRFL